MTSRWKEDIATESELVELLKSDIQSSKKDRVVVMAGHLPLLYHDKGPGQRSVEADPSIWGVFSTHSFQTGAELVTYARSQGKQASLALIVDDDCAIPKDPATGKRKDKTWMKKPRDRFYLSQELPEGYETILAEQGLSREDFVKQERSGIYVPAISEKRLKVGAIDQGHSASSECSLAYKGLVRDPTLFDKRKDLLISFIPGQCKGNLCSMLDTEEDLEASHIFFPHAADMGGVYTGIPEWNSVQEMLDEGKIIYRRDASD